MSRPITPTSAVPGSAPGTASVHPSHLTASRTGSYFAGIDGFDQSQGAPGESSVLGQAAEMQDETPHEMHQDRPDLQRSNSQVSQSQSFAPSRGGTLKKKPSLHKSSSLRRSGSRKSSYAGSVRSLKLGEKEKYDQSDERNSAFYCPVPTTGSPTELLANRFQAWRKVLKDLINYFRDLHKSYEVRSKALMGVSNAIGTPSIPPNFMSTGGLGEASFIVRDFHKQALTEANKARELENEVIIQLTGLRSDLQQKIKEIKGLSNDFKNSVDREQDGTKKAVNHLQETLGMVDRDASATSGKGDPFLVKMGVDRQLERQIEEENYLHRAFLNLEASGRELESIVVGEIQKAYNVLAGILRREADEAYDTAERLKVGPLAMAKDFEWDSFVKNNHQMVDPSNPVRQLSQITYPGKDHPAAMEVRSGMLERKSKYLKNYTPGWYILSPTHLHEFKSADRIAYQSPIMSLYLPEQKLGTHSEPGSSSHKFMIKGRQSGSMHRGHSWVFRAETYDTMMAWFADIKELTEKTGEDRNAFVRRTHARSLSGHSLKAASIGSSEGGMEEDEADRIAFSGEQSVRGQSITDSAIMMGGPTHPGLKEAEDNRSEAGWRPQRPAAGGRFPSELNMNKGLQLPLSPSSGESSDHDREVLAAAGALPGSGIPFSNSPSRHTNLQPAENEHQGVSVADQSEAPYTTGQHPNIYPSATGVSQKPETSSHYGEWMSPIAAGAGASALATSLPQDHEHSQHPGDQPIEIIDNSKRQMEAASPVPAYGTSSVPIPVGPTTSNRSRGLTESTESPTIASGLAGTASSGTDAGTVSTAPTAHSLGDHHEALDEKVVIPIATSDSSRPGLETKLTSKSISTLSDLHMPGEFPRHSIQDAEPLPTQLAWNNA